MTTTNAQSAATIRTADAEPVVAPRVLVPDKEPRLRRSAIAIDSLCKDYRSSNGSEEIRAVRQVSLEVPVGQHMAILGNSGSGKTTLLGCLSGRLSPTSGSVRAEGRIATIHQDLRLVKQRTVLQNVLHGALGRVPFIRTIIGFPKEEVQRAESLLERVGLGGRNNWPVGKLSGGEQQRVAIARALMQFPQIILADEPVASLDSENAAAVMGLLTELCRERNVTLVSVLHDCDIAETYADRIVGLDQGKVVYDGPTCDGPSFKECQVCTTIKEHADALRDPDNGMQVHHEVPRWKKIARVAVVLVLGLLAYGLAIRGLDIRATAFDGMAERLTNFVSRMLPASWTEVAGIPWGRLIDALLQTIGMSLVGTTVGIVISWPLAAMAAKNVGPWGIRHVARFFLNFIRTLPSIIWALLFVMMVGLGTFPGILALVAYSIGYLTKFFYEEFEGVDPGPPSALGEIGAGGVERFWHAVWPASRPAVLSSCFFMFEYNVRAASVLGLVGVPGIGWWLKAFFDERNFPRVTACIILLLIVVVILDAISTRIRTKLVQG